MASVWFAGCDNGESDDSDLFSLFPPGYFSQGFRQEFNMTGSAPSGLTTAGTHLVLTQAPEVFNGSQAAAVRTQNDWTDSNGGTFTNGTLDFYSTGDDAVSVEGFRDLVTQGELTNSLSSTLPQQAEPGDSGSVGTFVDGLGNTVSQNWALQSVSDTRARFIVATTVSTGSGTIVSEGRVEYEIDRDGRRQSLAILFDLKAASDPVSWTGTPQ